MGDIRKIRVTLLPDGTQRIEVLGATGDECVAFTRSLERRLGRAVGERTLKPEYGERPREAEVDAETEGRERAGSEGGG
jgi:hypothetical protein